MDVSYDSDIEDIRCDGNINLRQKLSSDLIKMLHNENFNDVCIKLHDGEVFANKVMLSARSEYFAASLRWKENNKVMEDAKHEIIFENCSMKIMALVIEYFYSGVLKVNDLTIMELLELREQVRILLPGDKIDSIIGELMQEERFDQLNILELIELRQKMRILLPEEEFLLQNYVDNILYDVVDEEDYKIKRNKVKRSFFLTNEEILTLIKSDDVHDRERFVEMCEFFNKEFSMTSTSRGQAMRASLTYHGALKSVEELYVTSESISLIPADQLKALILSTTDMLEISECDNDSDKDIILSNLRCKRVEVIGLDLSKRQTESLVRSMESVVEEINLSSRFRVKHLLKYQGNGKCKQIEIYGGAAFEQEFRAWSKQMDWSIKIETRKYDNGSTIELKRKDK